MSYYLGIDLGGTNIKAGVVNDLFQIVGRGNVKTQMPRPAEQVMDDMVHCAEIAAEDAGVPWDDIRRIGVGVPGTVNLETGVVEYANNLKFENLPMRDLLREKTKKEIDIANDADAAALGEMYAGAAKGVKDAVVVTLGTGVGGGVIINGKIFSGHSYGGAEIGHMGIVAGGRECNCGRRGCFETYASAPGLIRTTKEYMERYPDSVMWKLVEENNGKISGRTAFIAARQNDEAGQLAVDEYVQQLGYGVANIINILSPEILVIGGGVSNEGENLLRPLIECVKPQLYLRNPKEQSRIVLAKLGNDAGLIGAAYLSHAK